MAKVILYDVYQNQLQTYTLGENDPMPYSYGRTMLVREFRGSSQSNVLWTTNTAMEAWNATRRTYNASIPFRYAFKRIWEGGHGRQSQHYAGVAFDVGQALSQSQRNRIWNIANDLGVWVYVEPLSLTPTWVHFDKRFGTPACSTGGFPQLKRGSLSNYVLIAQDDLNTLGFRTGGLDGIFGSATQEAVKNYQRKVGLTADGIVGCNTWSSLQEDVVGTGKTSTTID